MPNSRPAVSNAARDHVVEHEKRLQLGLVERVVPRCRTFSA